MNKTDIYALKHIDAAAGLKYTGDEETYAGVLRDFHHFIPKNSAAIEAAAAAGAQEDYVREVHKLKSSARLIGAAALSEQALRLEAMGRDGEWSVIESETPRLLADYREFEQILAPFEEQHAPAFSGALSPEELRQTLEGLKKCAASFDYDGAMELLSRLESCALPQRLAELFPKLQDSVESFEFEDAENYVNLMLE